MLVVHIGFNTDKEKSSRKQVTLPVKVYLYLRYPLLRVIWKADFFICMIYKTKEL